MKETMKEVRMGREKPGEIDLTAVGINGFLKKQGFFLRFTSVFSSLKQNKRNKNSKRTNEQTPQNPTKTKHGPEKYALASWS